MSEAFIAGNGALAARAKECRYHRYHRVDSGQTSAEAITRDMVDSGEGWQRLSTRCAEWR